MNDGIVQDSREMTQRGALSAVFRPDRLIYIVCFVDFSVLGASAPRTFLLSAAQAAFFLSSAIEVGRLDATDFFNYRN